MSVAALALVTLVASGLVDPLWAAVVALSTVGWLWLMPGSDRRPPISFWPVLLLGGLVVGLAFAGPHVAHGWLADAWSATPSLARHSAEKAFLTIGATAFLLESGNIVVKVALRSESTPSPNSVPTNATGAVRSGVRLAGRYTVPARPAAGEPRKVLRGGRLIGPLERLLMVGLLFSGAVALIAAFVAAKGIVRFPEIQHDESRGTQAEYFLVGSMTSWALALAMAGLLWLCGALPGQTAVI